MDFRRPNAELVEQLRHALRRHGNGEAALRMDPRDTSFLGVIDEEAVADELAVIDAVAAVPVHY